MTAKRRFTNKLRRQIKRIRIPAILRPSYYWNSIATVFGWVIEHWKKQRIRDLLLGLPAIIGVVLTGVLTAKSQIQERSLTSQYYSEGVAALQSKDFQKAQLLLTRALRRGDSQLSDAQFAMAVLLEETNQPERAAELLKILAPDGEQGNREAHRKLATMLCEKVTRQSLPEEISRVFWHLTAANDHSSPEMAMAWGRYYLATGDIEAARDHFESAAETFPELWRTLGTIEVTIGNAAKASVHFDRSMQYLSRKLQETPRSRQVRIDYADVLIKSGKLNEAQMLLEQGKQLDKDGPWQHFLASLAVAYHDLNVAKGTDVSEALRFLSHALHQDPNHTDALNRLMGYATAKVEGNLRLRAILNDVIVDAREPALAHLALGNLSWLEGDEDDALFHFEAAMELRTDAPVILNNLAWILSHETAPPDLDRALAYVDAALEKQPNNSSFLDTRGSIYMLKKEWKPALRDLEMALPGVKDKAAVHRKLNCVYMQLGKDDIAERHMEYAEESKHKQTIPE